MTRHLPYDRTDRVADQIFQILSEAVQLKLFDPRLDGIAITRVQITKDLRTARICFHQDGASEERQKEIVKGLVKSKGYLKRCICESISLRFVPELEFFYDEGIDTRTRIEDLLDLVIPRQKVLNE